MLKRAAASKGVMGTLVGAGVGGAAYFATAKLAPKVSFLQGRWWATPTALLVVGHLAKRYSQETGQAVVGAAGALFAFSYYVQSAGTGTTPATTTTTPASGIMQGNAGYADTAGALMMGPGRSSAGYTRRSMAGALIT
jgi:hypothetical protein